MKLITGPLSMFGRKVEIALAEKGLKYEREFVPFSLEIFYNPVHPDVLRINPKKQVPLLIDDGLEIFDSTLIFEYLEDAYPETPLWPSNVKNRTNARLIELKSDEVFFENVQMFMPHRAHAFSDEQRKLAPQNIQEFYSNWNAQLSDGRDCLCGHFTFADIAVFMAQFFATFLGQAPSEDHTHLNAWITRTSSRSSVARAVEEMTKFVATG